MRRTSWAVLVAVAVMACPRFDHVIHSSEDGGPVGGGGEGGGTGGGITDPVKLTVIVDQLDVDAGTGVVTVTPTGDVCSATCVFTVQRGSTLTLSATIGTSATLTAWGGACSGFTQSCTLTISSASTVTAGVRSYNHVIVTKGSYLAGDLGDGDGGVGVADALCQQEAATSGLSGTFVPWLSTSKQDVRDRFPPGVRGWVLDDGTTIVPFIDELSSDWVYSARFSARVVATASDEFGRYVGPSCNDWSSKSSSDQYRSGFGLLGIPGWSNAENGGCGTPCALQTCDTPTWVYCFEANHAAPFPPKSAPRGSPLSFITKDAFPSGHGRVAFDAACKAEALDAGLPGTFLAEVDTSAVHTVLPAFPGTTWFRPDGVPAIETTVPPYTTTYSLAEPQVTADHRMVVRAGVLPWPASADLIIDDTLLWRGGCVDLLSTQSTSEARFGRADNVDYGNLSGTCDQKARILCVQVP